MYITCLLWSWLIQAQIKDFAREWSADSRLKGASLAYCVMDAATTSVLAEYNSKQHLIPASTLKLVTTAGALQMLGAGFTFQTGLYYRGTIDATGTLQGDLIIKGSGDPTLQSDKFGNNHLCDTWAKKIKDKGITRITGKIIGDASCMDHTVPDEWIWGDIGNYFGAVPCGLNYRDNKCSIYFNSGPAGSKTTIESIETLSTPQSFSLINEVMSGGTEDEAYVYGDPFSYTKIVKGFIPPNKTHYKVEASWPDPALLCATDLCQALKKAGIACSVDQACAEYSSKEYSQMQLIDMHQSPALDNIIQITNLHSNNLYCESILKTLGKGNSGDGIMRLKKHWFSRGLDTTQLFMTDGSGLSRANTVTTNFQTQLLCKIYRDSVTYKSMLKSLPIAGKSGSMANMGKGTFIENKLHAKTGYINRCRAYSGYVTNKKGRVLAFSIIFNNYNGSAREAKLKIEQWMLALVDL